jgi:hypothetical protein
MVYNERMMKKTNGFSGFQVGSTSFPSSLSSPPSRKGRVCHNATGWRMPFTSIPPSTQKQPTVCQPKSYNAAQAAYNTNAHAAQTYLKAWALF